MSGAGPLDASILLVLDSPNREQDEYGRCLVGASIIKLKQVCGNVGLNLADIRITHAVRCRAIDTDDITNDSIIACRKYLEEEIKQMPNLKVIVPMGNIPYFALTNNKFGIKKKPGGIKNQRGNAQNIADFGDITIVPTLSPSAILRNPQDESTFTDDFRKIKAYASGEELKSSPVNYTSVYDLEALEKFCDDIIGKNPVVFDIEATSKDTPYGTRILNITFSWKENTAYYLPINEADQGNYWVNNYGFEVWHKLHDFLKTWFENPNIKKIAHNMKYDISYMEVILGIRTKGLYFDTMLAHYSLDNLTEHDLGSLSEKYTDMGHYKDEVKEIMDKIKKDKNIPEERKNYGSIPVDILRKYALRDSDATFRLYKIFKYSLEKSVTKNVFYHILMPLTRIVADMEIKGAGYDIELAKKTSQEFQVKLDAISEEINKIAGKPINIRSPKQLQELFFNSKEDGGLGLKPLKVTKKGNICVDKEAVEMMAEAYDLDILNKIISYRSLATIKSTFLDGMIKSINPITGWLHPNFKIHGTTSGRLACIAKGSMVEVVRDLSKYPDGIPIEDVKAGDLAYCFDDDLKLTLRKVKWVGKTGNKKIIRVHWLSTSKHNKGYLDLTPEHRVRLTNGKYVEAKDLKKDDRVLSLSRDYTGDGYSRIYYSGKKEATRDHRFIKGCFEDIYKKHVHHKDHNKLNNNLDNLEVMTAADHCRYEASINKEERNAKISVTWKQKIADGYQIYHPTGPDSYNWLGLEKEWMEQVLWENAGQPTAFRDIHGIDYETAQKYMRMHGINYKDFSKFFNSKNELITKEMVEHSLELKKECKGQEKALKYLNTNFYRWKELIEYYKTNDTPYTPNNHIILSIEELDKYEDVYDMEIEDCHNFIVNEICVHNCNAPNLLNIPRDSEEGGKIRNIFIPKQYPGSGRRRVFVDGDVSGAEFRLLGEISGDPAMAKLFADDVDIHRRVASIVLGIPEDQVTKVQRYNAKSIVFGLMYGRGTKSVAKALGITEAQAIKFKEAFFALCPGAEKWIQDHLNKLRKEKYVQSIFGRVRHLPNINSSEKFIAEAAEREGLNMPIQSAASDYVFISMINIYNELQMREIDADIVLSVYDSILVECWEEDAREVYEIMDKYMTQKIKQVCHIPMKSEIAIVDRWSGQEIKLAA